MGSRIEFEMGSSLFDREKLSVNILKVGQEHCDPHKMREVRKWEISNSLHFILYGKGTLIANGKKLHLSKSDVFLLYANEEYEYFPDPNDPWSYIWVDFCANDTRALFNPCGITVENPTMHLNRLSSVTGLLNAMFDAYDASNLQQMTSSGYFLLLLSELIRNETSLQSTGKFSLVEQRHIRELITYINNNFRLQLTNQKIASENHISVSRMMALFAEVVGMSPIVYLNRFRVSSACELLRTTELSIREVANAVGVEDQLYFSRLFKKQKGVSPREYRADRVAEDPFGWMKERNIDFR